MLVFWKQKFVMLAVPKTGTTALEQALLPFASAAILDPPGQKHVSAVQYRNRLSKFFEQRGNRPMDLVAVMRDPVEWLGSWYRYRGRAQLVGKHNSTANLSFDEFVAGWLEAKRPGFADVGSQANFLTYDDGSPAVETLFRYDQMEDLVAFLERKLDTKLAIPQANVSPKGPVALSDAMRDRLISEASAEFDLWHRIGGA